MNRDMIFRFEAGAKLFNERRFWAAHEAWEAAWRDLENGIARETVQGFIQICAVCLKLESGEVVPAERLAKSALEHLRDEGAACLPVTIVGAATALNEIVAELGQGHLRRSQDLANSLKAVMK